MHDVLEEKKLLNNEKDILNFKKNEQPMISIFSNVITLGLKKNCYYSILLWIMWSYFTPLM